MSKIVIQCYIIISYSSVKSPHCNLAPRQVQLGKTANRDTIYQDKFRQGHFASDALANLYISREVSLPRQVQRDIVPKTTLNEIQEYLDLDIRQVIFVNIYI